MNMKGGKVFLLLAIFALAIFIFLAPASAQICTGVAHGYVKWENGSIVYPAAVTAVVSGCSGGGCNGTANTGSNGYYLISNLCMIQGDTVSLTATFGSSAGCTSGGAAGGGVAFVNITMCPGAPLLTPEPNTHVPSVSLVWTSGVDPGNATSLTDEYQLDGGGYSVQTSPKAEIGLSYTSHTWNVKTCNGVCCTCPSLIPSDSFTISNSPPPVPVLATLEFVNTSSTLLNWTSGGADPDGDDVHFEYQFGELNYWNITTDSNATSPQNESVFNGKTYNWRVRACDNTTASNSCSSWSTDTFTVCSTTCPECICPSGGGGGGGTRIVQEPSYVASVSAPSQVSTDETIIVYVNYKSTAYTESVKLDVSGPSEISFTPATITGLAANTEKTVKVFGKVAENATLGDRTLEFTATKNETKVISKYFTTSIVEEVPVKPPIEVIKEVPYLPFWLLLITLVSTITITALVARYRYKKKKLVKHIRKKKKPIKHIRKKKKLVKRIIKKKEPIKRIRKKKKPVKPIIKKPVKPVKKRIKKVERKVKPAKPPSRISAMQRLEKLKAERNKISREISELRERNVERLRSKQTKTSEKMDELASKRYELSKEVRKELAAEHSKISKEIKKLRKLLRR